MKIVRWDNTKQSTGGNRRASVGQMVSVTREEALQIVRSLVEQVERKSPNAGRLEWHGTVDRVEGNVHVGEREEYFSIGVEE